MKKKLLPRCSVEEKKLQTTREKHIHQEASGAGLKKKIVRKKIWIKIEHF